MIKFCGCGCGEVCKYSFLRGHSSRTIKHREQAAVAISTYNKSANGRELSRKRGLEKSFTKDQKERIGNSLKQYYKLHPEVGETKRQLITVFNKSNQAKKLRSAQMTGEGNNMFGKPSPLKSGNGWSGWYKNHYFRSLLELSYMLHLDENKLEWISAEDERFVIRYSIDGKTRTYRPDFYLPSLELLIEVKPYRLLDSVINQAKACAAKAKYKNYKIITETDVQKISIQSLKELCNEGVVELTEKWKNRLGVI